MDDEATIPGPDEPQSEDELRARLEEELQARGLLELAREDFDRLRRVNGRSPEQLPEACWRVSGCATPR